MLQKITPTLSGFCSSVIICKKVNLMISRHQHNCVEEEPRSTLLALREEQYWTKLAIHSFLKLSMMSDDTHSCTGEILLST